MGTFYIDKPELSYIHVPRTGMAMKKLISDWLKTNFDVKDAEPWMIDHPHLDGVCLAAALRGEAQLVHQPAAGCRSGAFDLDGPAG